MKIAMGLVAIVAIVLIVVYVRGVASYDPTAEGLAMKERIVEGMSWQEVIEATKEPRKFASMMTTPDGIEPAAAQPFKRTGFENMVKTGGLNHGFVFEYRFSAQAAYDVTFDGEGRVQSVADAMTMADLLHTR